jgi:hypothetical protein
MQGKKERIETAALVAEIVGAIAVVISVIYLAAHNSFNLCFAGLALCRLRLRGVR